MLHRTINANGVSFDVVEQGDGPTVLFVHGFPDTWRARRRQMEAGANAGYRAIALHMRGYGESSAPRDPALYTSFHTVGDPIGVLDVLGIATAIIVGHVFGANYGGRVAASTPRFVWVCSAERDRALAAA